MDRKIEKLAKLRKMLLTAALSVALISWYTTANGLNKYIFTKHLWQAYIFSAALQGALFSLSIKGIDLFFGFKNWVKKSFFSLMWICLLSTSSIFSYIYVSGDVYSEKLLCEDAQRILNTFCLEKNYKLFSDSNKLLYDNDNKAGVESMMIEYAKILAITEIGVDFSEDNKFLIKDAKNSVLPYRKNDIDKKNENNLNCVDTTFLVKYIDVILSGKYTENDVNVLEEEVENIISFIEQKEEQIKKNKELDEETVYDYQDRLKGYKETSSTAYSDLTKKLEGIQEEIRSLNSELSNLNLEKESVIKVKTVVNNINKSIESVLYDQVLKLQSEMNAEEIDTNVIEKIAEEIYNTLLENGITADDRRLIGYAQFRSNVKKYKAIIQTQKDIKKEIKELYALTTVVDESYQTKNNTVTEKNNGETKNRSFLSKNLTEDKDIWVRYWQERLNSLKNNVQTLSTEGIHLDDVDKLIESIEVRERLYLSDLNDFERSINLLFGTNPKHPYKVLLVFSFCFSFGIDLFSFFMSCLLYLLKNS